MGFRSDFMWGGATASYQIEGGIEDRGLTIWDVFAHQDDKVLENHDGSVACDHYNRMKSDVAIMKQMGLKAYRFSIAWARILPNGIGEINQKGLQFYSDLVDELIENGITPFVTLYHWDLPYELHLKGGWMNSDIVNWFSEYVRIVVEKLSDRVEYWMTQNEPQCYIGLGYRAGAHAPGLKCSWRDVLNASKNSMLAHGMAVKTIRKYSIKKSKVGYAPCGRVCIPKTETPEDIEAARIMMFDCLKHETHSVSHFVDPVILGKYPKGSEEIYGDDLPKLTNEDIELMTQPLDFLGLNNYHGMVVSMGKDGKPQIEEKERGRQLTAMDWDITPKSMYWGYKFLYERYKLPLYVTENGLANIDLISQDGKVYDYQRIDFVSRYLQNLKRASDEGVDIRGYFHWSLMDNYEWAFGYNRRFGMVFVDYENDCKRTIKESGKWYKKVIENNGEDLSLSILTKESL